MVIAALLSLLVVLPQEGPGVFLPKSPAEAEKAALQLIWEFYKGPYGKRIPGLPGPMLPISLGGPKAPLGGERGPSSCEDDTWEGCLGGDWGCLPLYSVKCLHPDQRIRRQVLSTWLEYLAPFAPNSAFLFRQRVAFALKNGEPEEADRIARECSETVWWCWTLRGLTAHWIDPGAGGPAFDSALVLAPPDLACFWRKIEGVASPALVASLGNPCEADSPNLAQFWWMADPLWSRPGNERHVEHLARHVLKLMEEETLHHWPCPGVAHLAGGLPNSWRHELVRYEATSEEALRSARSQLVCGLPWDAVPAVAISREKLHPLMFNYVLGGYSFAPESLRFMSPTESTVEDWAVEWNVGEERMLTRERWHNLDDQTAVFRRGPEMLVVAAATLPPPLDTAVHLEPFLNLGRVEDLEVFSTPARFDEDRVFRASMRVADGGYLASLEVVGPDLIGRARHGAPVPPLNNGFGLSDLALVDERFETEGMELENALLPSLSLPQAARVGIFFEVYGASEDETLEFRITAEPTARPSFLQRVLGVLHLRSNAPPVRVTWQEGTGGVDEPLVGRFFLLDTGGLPAGETRLTIAVTTADGTTASISRQINIRE